MSKLNKLPENLFSHDRKINLYYLHQTFKSIAENISGQLKEEYKTEVPITAGMWGGSYLIADETGKARTNVVRLYNIVNLPQKGPLEDKSNFEKLMHLYHEAYSKTFARHGLNLVDPLWGEAIPYTNKIKPTTTLQMWDASRRVKFVRAFFVWNTAPWEDSIIYDTVRNVRQIKELLDVNKHPGRKTSEELKFLLQDVLIIYFTLRPALTPDFAEHAEPIIKNLLNGFLSGLHGEDAIEEQFHRVYSNALVYGYEEALETPYKNHGLDIYQVENWPADKINWVPEELRDNLGPYLKDTFVRFKNNLKKTKNPTYPA